MSQEHESIIASERSLLDQIAEWIKIHGEPKTVIHTGTGLNKYHDRLENVKILSQAHISGVPSSHTYQPGDLILATHKGIPLFILNGRLHTYQGIRARIVVLPMKFLFNNFKIENYFSCSAVGALNDSTKVGDVVGITDHINLIPDSPLASSPDENMFINLIDCYDKKFIDLASKAGVVHKGIYIAIPGPHLETRAEYQVYKNMGGKVIGMSTVPEVIFAFSRGIRCFAISVITDSIFHGHEGPVAIESIIKAAEGAAPKVYDTFDYLLENI